MADGIGGLGAFVDSRFGWFLLGVLMMSGCGADRQPTDAAPSRFRNIVVLSGMTDEQIEDTMEIWGKQVGLECTDCHVEGDYASDEKHEKETARQMYQMVQILNEQNFFKPPGRQADCFLCHRGVKYIPEQLN